jgi:uncharacterized protein
MNLQTQLTEEMKQAMRDRDMVKLGVIRYLRSEIKNHEIDHGEQDDAGIQKIIASEVKKVKDALADFKKAGRDELVDQEEAKIAIMEEYLPEQMSDDDLVVVIDRVIAESDEKHMGKIIGAVMKEVAGKADGGRVSQLIKEKL